MNVLPLEIPDAATLRQLREEIGLSQPELAAELGFGVKGPDVIRSWEAGTQFGKPFGPTPLAWRCFRMIVVCCRTLALPDAEARGYLRANLSERVTG